VLVDDGLHDFEWRSLFFDYKLTQFLNLNLLVLPFEFLHVHKASTNADSQGTVSDGRDDEAGAYKVLGVVNSDDGEVEGVLADIGLQEFIDGIGVSRGFVGEGLGEARV
jgi:hypothetical protein